MERHLIILKTSNNGSDNPDYTLHDIYPAATHRASSLIAARDFFHEHPQKEHTVHGYYAMNGNTQEARRFRSMQTLSSAAEILPYQRIGEHPPQ